MSMSPEPSDDDDHEPVGEIGYQDERPIDRLREANRNPNMTDEEIDEYLEAHDCGFFGRYDDEAIERVVGQLRRFHLVRVEDESGVSGTGIVASGVQFHDGTIAYRWRTAPEHARSTWQIAEHIADVIAIHGHGGRTHVVWEDPP